MMENQCACEGGIYPIYCCSGGSNVGQIANRTAIRLEGEDVGKFSCLAGIGGNTAKMVENAKSANKRIVIDGCPTSCGKGRQRWRARA
jgi:uncharacterized metal-binding protein